MGNSGTRQGRLLSSREAKTAYAFLLPVLICVTAVLIYPILKAIMMSFQDWFVLRASPHEWIGIENYRAVVGSEYFWFSVRITAVYVTVTVIAKMIIGSSLSIAFNREFPGKPLVLSTMIAPWAVPVAVGALVWMLMLDPVYGIVNYIGVRLGLFDEPVSFLGQPGLAFWMVIAFAVWKGFPLVFVMMTAGLKSVPSEIYEAALIDGADGWQLLRRVTLPVLKPVWVVTLLLEVIWAIQEFEVVYLVARGGPARATSVLTVYIYDSAFQNLRIGEASAAGTLLLIVAAIFTMLYLRILKGEEPAW